MSLRSLQEDVHVEVLVRKAVIETERELRGEVTQDDLVVHVDDAVFLEVLVFLFSGHHRAVGELRYLRQIFVQLGNAVRFIAPDVVQLVADYHAGYARTRRFALRNIEFLDAGNVRIEIERRRPFEITCGHGYRHQRELEAGIA